MGVSHVTVERIEAATDKHIKHWETNLAGFEEKNREELLQRTRFVDGCLVLNMLADYCDAIRAKNPQVKFGVDMSFTQVGLYVGHNSQRVRLPKELWAYYEGDVYAVAKVECEYNTYTDTVGDHPYQVYARTIKNERYSAYAEEFHLLKTKNLVRAVKNFNTYARRYKLIEIAEHTIDVVYTPISQARSNLEDAVRLTRYIVQSNDEFAVLLTAGVDGTPPAITDVYRQQIQKYFYAKREHDNADTNTYVTMVIAGLDGSATVATYNFATGVVDVPVTTYTQGQVPEHIQQSLAVLSMLDSGQQGYVEGVGARANSRVYWLVNADE